MEAESQEDNQKHGINFWFSVEDVIFFSLGQLQLGAV